MVEGFIAGQMGTWSPWFWGEHPTDAAGRGGIARCEAISFPAKSVVEGATWIRVPELTPLNLNWITQ